MARNIEFDRKEVLQKALEIFWRDGYCKCSIARLVDATRLQPGSLYAAFKSKEGLFLATLEYYGRQSVKNLQACLESTETPLQGIRKFIEKIGDTILNRGEQRGCFLVNTVLEFSPQKEAINHQVDKYFQAIESLLFSALQTALDRGELSPDRDPEVLAKYLMVNIWGLQVLAKTNPEKIIIQKIVDQITATLDT